MTDYEALKWLLDHFKDIPKDFSSSERWEALERAVTHYKEVYTNSPYTELLESYHRALYEIASINYIINNKGGLPDCLLTKNTNSM